MNGLKALKHIKEDNFPVMIASYPPMPATFEGYTKEELFSIIEEELKAGEKHKKALEIIKREPNILSAVQGYENYDDFQNDEEPWLDHDCVSRDEFDLLKEVMG